MSVVPDALDKILWRDMFSLEVSVVGETEHPTKLLVKKRQGEILCSVYSRLMVHLGRKPIPDHKKCSGPNFKAHVNIWWEFPLHALAQRWFRNVHVATLLKSFPSNIYIYISGSSKRTDLWSNDVDASWPNFQCFCLFCGWGTPSVWKVHFRKHLPCRNECSLRSMHSPEKCQHKWF